MELKDLKELIRFVDKTGLTEFEFESGEVRVYLSKQVGGTYVQAAPVAAPVMAAPAVAPAAAAAPAGAPAAPAALEIDGLAISSPIVGTFYAAPSPDAAVFVKEGDVVEKGQTLCIVEAMKIMNEIEAEYKCQIKKIVVENGRPVEFGQPLFIVEKL